MRINVRVALMDIFLMGPPAINSLWGLVEITAMPEQIKTLVLVALTRAFRGAI